MNLADIVSRWTSRRPDRLAVDDGSLQWTWRELSEASAQAAAGLAASGVGRGDRVAVLALNRGEILVLLLACARLGTVMVPLNWRLTAHEQAWSVQDAGCTAIVGEPSLLVDLLDVLPAAGAIVPLVVSLPEADSPQLPGAQPWDELTQGAGSASTGGWSDDLLIVYTSGTTGRPKGAVLTQSAVAANAVNATHMHDLVASDVVLTALPLFHVGGLNIQTMPALLGGATVLLQRRFEPAAWLAAVADRRPTLSVAVPTMIRALLDHPAWASTDLSSLRMLTTGSQVVPLSLIEAVHARGLPVVQVYGATETAPIALYQRREDALAQLGTVGREGTLCELRIVDANGSDVADATPGELWVRSPSLFRGYWQRPEETAAVMVDGWYHTGDVGHRLPSGAVVVSDRIKDVVISGGENVYPAEVEAAIAATGLVSEVAVIGREDHKWGEVPVAFVVPGPDIGTVDAQRLSAALSTSLARFKHPHLVITVDELPRNAMGKVQKHELRARFAISLSSPGSV
jgi:fatty-acyl-CoA synthase